MIITGLVILLILLSVLPKTDQPTNDNFYGDPYDYNTTKVTNSIDDDFDGDPYDHSKKQITNSIDDNFYGDPFDY